MNQMFRPSGRPVTKIDDVVASGHLDWNGRVERAIASNTAWKRLAFSVLGVTALSISWNIYQETNKPPPTVIHVVHNSIGGVVAVTANKDGSDAPSQLQFKAAMEDWVKDCRTIYVDINAMRKGLYRCAWLIEKSSQAEADMARFYNRPHKEEPFYRAGTETVQLTSVVAMPPTSAEIGQNQMQTWSISWQETVTSRDGSFQVMKPWGANVTFIYRQPQDTAEAQRNPNGIHVVSFTWTEK
jgi:type IV secretory pathway TrbF-like protein